VLAEWPLSGTGRYRLTLEFGDAADPPQEVEVAPEKISPTAYGRLIDDLQTDLPASIAIGLQRAGALAGLHLRPPGETTLGQELARLRRAVTDTNGRPGLASMLRTIAKDPHRILRKVDVWVGRERVRRLEPVGMIAAFRRAENIDQTRLPVHVPDVRVEHTVDVYENRLLKAYHDQVTVRLRRLAAAFGAANQMTGLLETEELLSQLSRARLAAAFLDQVSDPGHQPTRVTMVLQKRPEYRALLRGYLEFRRSAFVELDEPALEAPLENLPYLYEVWGTLKVIKTFIDVGNELGLELRSDQLVRHVDGGVYVKVLPNGRPAVEFVSPTTGTAARLIPQRTYARSGRHLRSISFSQVPDVSLEIRPATGSPRIYLFDPKYKLQSEETGEPGDGKPKKIDIDTMHAYRDAIRDEDENRVVRYAAILYPGPETRYGDGIEALSARPLQPLELQDRVRAVLREALRAE
jgi:predicted component of viral defense system (DUF524 family)